VTQKHWLCTFELIYVGIFFLYNRVARFWFDPWVENEGFPWVNSTHSLSWWILILHVLLFQVPLFNILKKFDGETVTEVVRPRVARMKYRVIRLPQYLILHMQRFKKNNFFIEKNPTLGKARH
jgi:hypothetical protein